jgi:hypothetical protein
MLLTMVLAMAAGAQTAGTRLDEVNKVKLGSDLEEFKLGPGAACIALAATKPNTARFMCSQATYGGVAAKEMVSFYYGRLESFLFLVPHEDFKTLRDVMMQKFGKPAKQEHIKVAGPQGPIQGEYSEWGDEQTMISLNEASGIGPNIALVFLDRAINRADLAGAPLSATTTTVATAAESAAQPAQPAHPVTSADGAQPYEVKGVKMGAPLAEWRSGPGAECKVVASDDPTVSSFTCPGQTYAGVPVGELVTFYDGRLVTFNLLASHDNFRTLRDALDAKFGPPTDIEQKIFADHAGHIENGERHFWTNLVSIIDLLEYTADLDHSTVTFMHMGVWSEHNKKAKAKAKTDDM